jgi:putative chitinase
MILLHDPMRLTRPTAGCRSAVWFWNDRGLNAIADQNTEDAFKKITRVINGGMNGYHDRKRFWDRARSVLGATQGADT